MQIASLLHCKLIGRDRTRDRQGIEETGKRGKIEKERQGDRGRERERERDRKRERASCYF